MGGFCLVVELAEGESVTNGATPFSLEQRKEMCRKRSNINYIIHSVIRLRVGQSVWICQKVETSEGNHILFLMVSMVFSKSVLANK